MSHPENTCTQCHSPKIEFNQDHGFYKCLNCGHLWGYDQDDPDYEESAIQQLFGDFPYNQVIAVDEPNLIPRIYSPPLGLPLYWRNEQTGSLAIAVMAYLKSKPLFPYQIFQIKCYLEHYINAPCWVDDSAGILRELRLDINTIKSVKDIDSWLDKAMEIALDPL